MLRYFVSKLGLGIGLALGFGIVVLSGAMLWQSGWLSSSPDEDRTIVVGEANTEDLAYIIFDCSDGLKASALVQKLCGIVAININSRPPETRRDFSTIFRKMLEYVPESLESQAIAMKAVREKIGVAPISRTIGRVFGETASIAKAKLLAADLLKAHQEGELATLLPDGRKNLVCVDKTYYADAGRWFGVLGSRLGVPESDFPGRHKKDGRTRKYQDGDGYQFFCP